MTQGFSSGIPNPLPVTRGGTGSTTASAARTALELAYASQADQETGTATDKVVAPGTQQYHESADKAWANIDGTGTASVTKSYNVSGIVDNGTADYTITIDNDMSDADFAVVGGHTSGSGLVNMVIYPTRAVGSVLVRCYTCASSSNTSRSQGQDFDFVCVSIKGDL